jgi:sigma-B regulation protein RsbU (phosphoserine phosphatase)
MKKLSDCRILLVDDTKANLDILAAGLKSDYKLNVALSGEAALDLVPRIRPDLILLDVMMPGLDGYEVCRRLRAHPETREVPIVFVSALDEIKNKARGFEVGANDYVTKPFDLLEVKARVNALLKAKAYNDAVKAQIVGELRVAREIQMGMLPHDFAGLARQYGVALGGQLLPAGEVGGDLLAAFGHGPDRLVLVLGDVSGKGIPAALFMVRTLSMLRLLARDVRAPEQILARLNDELAADNPSSMFVTLACAVYEPASRRLALASAGQPCPVLLRRSEPPRYLSDRLGTALGLEPGITFTRIELTLAPGDLLVFYTDGVTEAFDGRGECYGSARFLSDLNRLANAGPEGATAGVLARVQAFANGTPQSDDIAVLALQLAGTSETQPRPTRLCLEFTATPQNVMAAVDALRAFGQEQQLTEAELFGPTLALEECASNIVQHACHNDAALLFSVALEFTGELLSIVLSDPGSAADPGVLSASGSAPDHELGGWGLHLARSFVDTLSYVREGDRNLWHLTKRLRPIAGPSRDVPDETTTNPLCH